MNFILSWYYYYNKGDTVTEKEMFFLCVYGIFMLEIDTGLIESKYSNLDGEIKGMGLVLG